MALKTKAEYIEDMKEVKPNVYYLGEKVERVWDDPRFQSMLNLIGATHNFSFDKDFKDLSVVHSPLVDEPIRRLNMYIQTIREGAIIKVQLTRESDVAAYVGLVRVKYAVHPVVDSHTKLTAIILLK